jgi:hyaluronate lyase
MKKKFLAVVLSSVMILSVLPAAETNASLPETGQEFFHPVAMPPAPSPLVAPEPPEPDSTIWLTEGTQEELVNAIQNAQGGGHVTKIILKADTGIPIDTELPHFDLTDGKVLVIDFNGGWIDYNVPTRLWFEAQLGVPQAVSSIGSSGSDAVLNFASALPDGLQVGDYVKVVSEDRPPGGRSNYLKLGEAMKVKAINGLAVTLEGGLLQQGLYKTQIRAAKFQGTPEGLWLIQPKLVGDLSYDIHQIRLVSLIKPRVISPDASISKGQLINLENTIEAVITDPLLHDGVDGAWPNTTYGVYSFASKNTWVYRTDGSTIASNTPGIRHGVDAGSNTPQNKDQVYRYGNDIGLRVTGLHLWDTLNVNASVHSGSWGALLENLSIRRNGPSAAAGITIRGDFHTIRNIDIAEVTNGWQIYNERGEFVASPIDESPKAIVIDGGRTVVSGLALFTSTGTVQQAMPIGRIVTRNSPYWESSTSGHLFDLNYETKLDMNGDVIKVTGTASRVFQVSGSSRLNANHITIDLSEYQGDSITLFYADEGSVVNVRDLNLINPHGKTVVFGGGAGVINDVDPSRFEPLILKWKDFLIGHPLDLNDPDIAAKVAEITSEAQNYWNSMNKSANRGYLWSDLAGTTWSYEITANYNRLKSMALSWATDGSALYGNPSLLDDIIGGMEWMYQNRYNEYTAKYNNWWDWEIGVPLAINDLCVLLYGHLSDEQIARYMRATLSFPPHEDFTGANQVWESMINALRGVLLMDPAYIAQARDDLSSVFPYSTYYDGFYEDGSFLQHLKHPYNGGYGKSLLDNLGKLLYFLDGTEWEVTDPESSNVYRWIYDSYAPFIYKGSLMSYVRGREAPSWTQQEHGAGHKLMAYIARIALFAPEEDALAYKRMIKEWINEDTYDNVYADMTPHEIKTIKEIMNDSSITPRTQPVMFKHFGVMDRTLQVRPDYAFGISMHSKRIYNYESANGENEQGWHTGDGMTYLYNNDLSQFSDYFWQTVNPYRLPGTTVDTKPLANSEGSNSLGMDWVGGAGLDNLYGVAGMHLKASKVSLQAQKSWFMFDDEIVALGAGITSTDNRTIETIIDNRKLNTNGDNKLTVDGSVKPSDIGWNESMNAVNWIHLEGNVPGSDMGYYFPGSADVKGLREARTNGDIMRDYMNLWFDHGANPSGGSYAYVLLPNRTSAEVSDYAGNPDITILRNDADVQAVRENTLNITGINFWKDGLTTVGDVTSDKKAALIMREGTGTLDVSLSDPTQINSGKITIEINREAAGILEAAPEITVVQLSPTIKFTLGTKGKAGKSFQVKFLLNDPGIISLNPTADAHVIDGSASNYGNSTNLETIESETPGKTKRSYLKFDLGGIEGADYIARLRVYGRSLAEDYTNVIAGVHEVEDDNWTESGINWNNKPEAGALLGTGIYSTVNQWRDYDVTSFVKDQLTGDKVASFAVISADVEKMFRFNSRNNASNKPVLYLVPKRAIPVEGVHLDAEEIILNTSTNSVRQLEAIVLPQDATNRNVQWSTGDPNVAVVDETGKVTAVGDGVTTVTVATEDGGFQDTVTVIVDSQPPLTVDNVMSEWRNTEQTAALQATDELSGVAETWYRVDSGEWTEGNSVAIGDEGIHVIEYYSVDRAGNVEETKTAEVKLDLTPPVVEASVTSVVYRTDAISFPIIITDALSGLAQTSIKLDGVEVGHPIEFGPYSLSLGEHVIEASATDLAGNELVQSYSFQVTMDIGYLDEAMTFGYAQGWIDNVGILNSLLSKVNNIQKEPDNPQLVLNGLNALENQIQSQAGKHISQAFADLLLADFAYIRRHL